MNAACDTPQTNYTHAYPLRQSIMLACSTKTYRPRTDLISLFIGDHGPRPATGVRAEVSSCSDRLGTPGLAEYPCGFDSGSAARGNEPCGAACRRNCQDRTSVRRSPKLPLSSI